MRLRNVYKVFVIPTSTRPLYAQARLNHNMWIQNLIVASAIGLGSCWKEKWFYLSIIPNKTTMFQWKVTLSKFYGQHNWAGLLGQEGHKDEWLKKVHLGGVDGASEQDQNRLYLILRELIKMKL